MSSTTDFLTLHAGNCAKAFNVWTGIKQELVAAARDGNLPYLPPIEHLDDHPDELRFKWLGHPAYVKFSYFPHGDVGAQPVRIEYGTIRSGGQHGERVPQFQVALGIDGSLPSGSHVMGDNAVDFHRQALRKLADYLRPVDADDWAPALLQ